MSLNSVLFATGCLGNENSGPYHSLKQTVTELSRQGHLVSVLGTITKNHQDIARSWPCDIKTFRRYGPNSLHYAPALASWLQHQSLNPEIVSMQGVWLHTNHALATWCLQHEKPFMITAHGNFNPHALKLSAWKKYLASKTFMTNVLRHVNCYQALTPREYQILRQAGITAPICVIGNGIELPNYTALTPAELILPKTLLHRRTCLYLGRLDPIKGVDRLLSAWGKIVPTDDWQLIIAGSGKENYETYLKKIAVRLNCKNTHFVGSVSGSTKSAWIQQAEFMVLPSYSEAFPMTVLEGFSFGRPSLLTDQCGLPEANDVGASIEVLSTEDSIAEGLQWMLDTSQENLRSMGQVGLNLVHQHYTWPKITAQLKMVYQWLNGCGTQPDCVEMN